MLNNLKIQKFFLSIKFEKRNFLIA